MIPRIRTLFEPPTSPGRIIPMEGLRGVAALMVLFVHFHSLFSQFTLETSWVVSASLFLSSIGHTGVDLFFVLSGLLMYRVMLKSDFRWLTYVWRRTQRLYPVFLAVFAAYLILSYEFPEYSKITTEGTGTYWYLLLNLLMLPGLLPINPLITQAWSLSYEWCFYVSGPIVVGFTGMREMGKRARALLLCGLTAVYLSMCFFGLVSHPRMAMFLCGCLILEAVNSGWLPWILSAPGEIAATVAFLANLALIGWNVAAPGPPVTVLNVSPGYYTGLLWLSSFFFAGHALFYRGGLGRFFSLSPLRWVGNMSYSYYLTHGMVLHGIRLVTLRMVQAHWANPSNAFFALLFLVCLAATLVVASVFYLLFERPFLNTRGSTQLSGPSYFWGSATELTKEVH